MSELIRREDAIKATWKEPSYTDPLNVLTEVRDRIEALPTIDTVEVVHGHWIIDGAYTYDLKGFNGPAYEPVYRCSCCHRQTESYLRLDEPKMPEDADFPEFCPHCGARMDGERRES